MTPVVELDRVAKTYRVGPLLLPVLTNISLRVEPGEFVAITGGSGSGKSTLLHLLGLLDHVDSGRYLLDGREIGSASDDERTVLRNHKIGFIFQQAAMFPRFTVEENVAVPLQYRGAASAVARDAVREILARVGLSGLGSRLPSQLSGGQLQRVALARALVGKPKLILADEPTASLDERSAEEVITLLLEINREAKAAVVLITHQIENTVRAHRHFQLHDGALHLVADHRNTEVHS